MPTNRLIPLLALTVAVPIGAWAAQVPSAGGDIPGAGVIPAQGPAVPGGAATPAAPAAEPAPTEADLAVDAAVAQVRKLESVAATLRLDADMLNQRFGVVGDYLKAPGNRILTRLSIDQLADVTGTLQQVCDGTTIWNYRQILDSRGLQRQELAPVLKLLEKPEVDADIREKILGSLGFSGPDTLLAGLRKSVAFTTKEAGTYEGKPVWILRGTWKDRDALALPGAPAMPNGNPVPGAAAFLPSYVPSLVELTIGQEDGWPWKVLLKGRVPSVLRDERQLGPDGRPIGRKSLTTKKERATDISLVWTRLDRAVEPGEFLFQPPPGVEVQDTTEVAVGQYEQLIAALVAQKRNDTGSGALLDQGLSAPRPDGGPAPDPGPAPAPGPSGATFRSSVPAPPAGAAPKN